MNDKVNKNIFYIRVAKKRLKSNINDTIHSKNFIPRLGINKNRGDNKC